MRAGVVVGYWTTYWFQGIACFRFASTATFSGLTGSALMLPWLIMGFAFLPVPEITAQQAVAASIFVETVAPASASTSTTAAG